MHLLAHLLGKCNYVNETDKIITIKWDVSTLLFFNSRPYLTKEEDVTLPTSPTPCGKRNVSDEWGEPAEIVPKWTYIRYICLFHTLRMRMWKGTSSVSSVIDP